MTRAARHYASPTRAMVHQLIIVVIRLTDDGLSSRLALPPEEPRWEGGDVGTACTKEASLRFAADFMHPVRDGAVLTAYTRGHAMSGGLRGHLVEPRDAGPGSQLVSPSVWYRLRVRPWPRAATCRDGARPRCGGTDCEKLVRFGHFLP